MNSNKKFKKEYLNDMYKYYLRCKGLDSNTRINLKDINFLKWLKEQLNILNTFNEQLNIEPTDIIIEINTGEFNSLKTNNLCKNDVIQYYSKKNIYSNITDLEYNEIILNNEPSIIVLNNCYDEKLINQLIELDKLYDKRIAIGFYGNKLDSNIESNMLRIMDLHKKMDTRHQITFTERNEYYSVVSQTIPNYKNYYRKK